MIEIKDYFVHDPGDLSVGIFPGDWVIEGDFFFEDLEEKTEFEDKLREAFVIITDNAQIREGAVK